MALTPGTRLGPYEVTAQLGVGGMGEVYRATDTKLGRQVAIKVLPTLVAQDAERLARFDREARTLAALNHPNIAAIYGLEDADGAKALVMELVEGPTLADRITQEAIPVDEALPLARQIAEALEAAHEQGIIHRDLKPANIKVRPDGAVKVLDFGLAKALGSDAASAAAGNHSMMPTITTPAMTQAGMILGTAAYMSPEQARGKTVDKRADIWAFGAVLFEMLAGKRAFPGEDITDTLALVVRGEPGWDALPPTVPARVRQVLRSCLQKEARQRLGDMQSVRLALDGVFETAAPQALGTNPAPARSGRLAWMAAFAVAVAVAAALAIPALRYLREAPPPAPPETRLEITTPATGQPASFALSSDGRQIVFVASGDGVSRLWVRSLATTTAQPLAGTEGATAPFWSPDSRSIGFFATAALRRVELGGGVPQTLAPATSGGGGTWNADGVIVFSSGLTTALMRVPATGGAVMTLTTLGPGQRNHRYPWFLPDGRHFVFYAMGTPDAAGIYLGALDGDAPTRLAAADGSGVYLPSPFGRTDQTSLAERASSGWLLWVRAGALVAQRLDVAKAALTGEPVTLAEAVAADAIFSQTAVSVADTGLVAYRIGGGGQRQLTWLDRSGTARGTVGDADRSLNHPRVSPDSRRVAVQRMVGGNTDLWLLDGGRTSRFTFDASVDVRPVWSPDGTRVAFASEPDGADGPLPEARERRWRGRALRCCRPGQDREQLVGGCSIPAVQQHRPTDEHRPVDRADGGRSHAVAVPEDPVSRGSGRVLAGRPVGGVPVERIRTGRSVRAAVRSADGSKSGASTAPAAASGQWQVSTSGGIQPAWRRDGKELYYLSPAGAMMAVPITTGATLSPGAPVVLFPTRIVGGGVDTGTGRQYDVAPDGRFLVNTELDAAGATAPITLIQNWNPEAKK